LETAAKGADIKPSSGFAARAPNRLEFPVRGKVTVFHCRSVHSVNIATFVQVATSVYIPPMADDPQSLVLGHLRAIRADIRDMKLKMDEMAGAQSGILRVLASHDECV
jgi:hypothetical protein